MQIKNVLVTGAGGFIGSYLTEKCVESGYRVKAFIRYNSKNNWGWLEDSKYKKEIEIITGDIRDFDSVYKALHSCDTVFHLAALIGIPYSYISPLAYIKTNIEGTYNILEASRQKGTGNVLITSTSEIYGTAQYVPIDEKHPMVGQSPYAATKIAADELALSFYRSFDLPVKVVRPFNTYGPRQSARAIIPTVIIQLLNKRKKIKVGNVLPTRDLTFVKDTVNGYMKIAESNKFTGEVTNIGMNKEIKIEELIMLIVKLMNKKVEIDCEDTRIRPDKSEVNRLLCDNSKLIKNTGWKPAYDLSRGLKETINWFRKHMNYYKSDIYNF